MEKALFLDRDGIINIDKGYVYKKEDFEFIESIFDISRYYLDMDYLIFIITNQAGIARGYYSEDDYLLLTKWMKNKFKQNNVTITDVYYCPHHPIYGVGKYNRDCECRKPKAGMILKIAEKYNIDLQASVLIGDKISDIQAGITSKIKNNFLIKSKYQEEYDFESIKKLLKSLKRTNR